MCENSMINEKKVLSEIAEIKKIKLCDIRAEDLLVTDKFHQVWCILAGSENTEAKFLVDILNNSPRFLDDLNLAYLTQSHMPDNMALQHLDIFQTKRQDVNHQNAEDNRRKETSFNFDQANESIIANNQKGFLLREVAVVRLREGWKDRISLPYIQRQVENNLPDLLAEKKPETTYGQGCSIPNRIPPPDTEILGNCLVEIIPTQEQFDPVGIDLTAKDAFEQQVRPFYKHLDTILQSLAHETIQTKTLAECLAGAPPIPSKSWPWTFLKELGQHLDAMVNANNNLANSPANSAVQLIGAHEGLKTFLVEHGPWGGGERSLFERIIVARLALAMPEQDNLWTAIEGGEKRREAELKAEEKERIMGILSHNIKNLLASAVIDPLQLMKLRGIGDNAIVDAALRGAGLLNEMVNAVNLSQSGTKEDLLADLKDPDEKALSLSAILRYGLRAAFTNMFDSKYFNKYYSIHFPEDDLFYEAREIFVGLPSDDTGALLDFGYRYLHTTTTWDCPETIAALKIGNRRNSALKLLILFQELFMNAVKNATFTEPDRRSLAVAVHNREEKIDFIVSNSFNPDETRADTRLGQGIVNSLLRQFGAAAPAITKKDGIFTIRFSLPNVLAAGKK